MVRICGCSVCGIRLSENKTKNTKGKKLCSKCKKPMHELLFGWYCKDCKEWIKKKNGQLK